MAKVRCKICLHPCRQQIDHAIAKRVPDTVIAAQYENAFSTITLASHRTECIRHALVAAESAMRVERGIDVKALIFENNSIYQRAKRACVRWLTSVDDPDEFDLDPRATEIEVVYLDHGDCDERGKPTRKKAPLQELLSKIELGAGYEVRSHYDKSVDVRRYVLDVLSGERDDLEFYAKLMGLLQKERENENDERAKFDKEVERIMSEGWDRVNAEQIAVDANVTGQWMKFLGNGDSIR
jgi:hypothetical protein